MSRSFSGRSRSRPLGNVENDTVQRANVMVSRTILIIWLLTARGCLWVLEQPSGSTMQYHPRFNELLTRVKIYRTHVRMCEFGGDSVKGTWLYSAHKLIGRIGSYRTTDTVTELPVKKLTQQRLNYEGRFVTDGLRGDMKESQHYPPGFGRALASLFADNQHEIHANAMSIVSAASTLALPGGTDLWADARLTPVIRALSE